jgi:Uma2 family endonuclease
VSAGKEDLRMLELKLGFRTVDLPHPLRISPVTEEMFDELVNEDVKAELIDGVMIVHSPASLRHDAIAGFLRFLMLGYASAKRLGSVLGPDSLIRLGPGRRFAPDLFFLKRRRVPRRLPQQFEGAPDLVLEVLSPSNRDEELEEKRPAYRRSEIVEIWLVDPEEQQIQVDRRRRSHYTTDNVSTGRVTSAALPGFWIEAGWLWQEPLPNQMNCLQQILG